MSLIVDALIGMHVHVEGMPNSYRLRGDKNNTGSTICVYFGIKSSRDKIAGRVTSLSVNESDIITISIVCDMPGGKISSLDNGESWTWKANGIDDRDVDTNSLVFLCA